MLTAEKLSEGLEGFCVQCLAEVYGVNVDG